MDNAVTKKLLEFGCFVLLSLIIAGLSEISLRALHRATQAEREKDNFMAAVAHEMRSPLSVIYYTNTMRRMNASDASNDRLDVIDRQVSHLNLMIEDLLDVSRAARGKLTLHKVHADVGSNRVSGRRASQTAHRNAIIIRSRWNCPRNRSSCMSTRRGWNRW